MAAALLVKKLSPTSTCEPPYDDRAGRGAARAEDAQGTPTQSHMSPSILVYEDKRVSHSHEQTLGAADKTTQVGQV